MHTLIVRGARTGADWRGLVAVAVWAALAASALAQSVASSPARDQGIIPDTGGAIREIVVHYDADFNYELTPTYRDLFAHLGDHVHIQVLCSSPFGVSEFYQRWGAAAGGNGRTLQVIDVGGPLTLWARDRRVGRTSRGSGAPVDTFVPTPVDHYSNDKIFELGLGGLLRQRGFLRGVLSERLHLEGGNIVASDSRAFVGANVYEDNPASIANPAVLQQRLEAIAGLPVEVVGELPDCVPWIHVDMYLTPIDDTTLLLASPTMARELMAGAVPAVLLDFEGEPIYHPAAPAGLGVAALESIADQLRERGFTVHRLPAVMGPYEEWMITYNNVVMDRCNGQRIVLMPVYRIPRLDAAAEKIYRDLGFDVRRVDVAHVYKCGGAIRCLANVPPRDPVMPASMPPAKPSPAVRRAAVPQRDGPGEPPLTVRPVGHGATSPH